MDIEQIRAVLTALAQSYADRAQEADDIGHRHLLLDMHTGVKDALHALEIEHIRASVR